MIQHNHTNTWNNVFRENTSTGSKQACRNPPPRPQKNKQKNLFIDIMMLIKVTFLLSLWWRSRSEPLILNSSHALGEMLNWWLPADKDQLYKVI